MAVKPKKISEIIMFSNLVSSNSFFLVAILINNLAASCGELTLVPRQQDCKNNGQIIGREDIL